MGILLLLLGVLAAASGALKLRQRTRSRLGSSPLAVAEVLLGAATALGSGLGLPRVRPAAWTAVAAILFLVCFSSFRHFGRALEYGRRRAASEGDRLRRHVGS